jgi:DNA-binding NarL/FixJ family response regulator
VSKSAGPPLRVLIADRDPDFARALQLRLESAGGAEVVAVASDGDAAVTLAAELLPDVVLLDPRMPPVDGVQVAARLYGQRLKAAVVMFLDDTSAAEVARARAAGVRAFVARADAEATLLEVLREVVRLSAPTVE